MHSVRLRVRYPFSMHSVRLRVGVSVQHTTGSQWVVRLVGRVFVCFFSLAVAFACSKTLHTTRTFKVLADPVIEPRTYLVFQLCDTQRLGFVAGHLQVICRFRLANNTPAFMAGLLALRARALAISSAMSSAMSIAVSIAVSIAMSIGARAVGLSALFIGLLARRSCRPPRALSCIHHGSKCGVGSCLLFKKHKKKQWCTRKKERKRERKREREREREREKSFQS